MVLGSVGHVVLEEVRYSGILDYLSLKHLIGDVLVQWNLDGYRSLAMFELSMI